MYVCILYDAIKPSICSWSPNQCCVIYKDITVRLKHIYTFARYIHAMCAYRVIFVLVLAVQLNALPVPLPTSCSLVSHELGYFIQVSDNGTLTAADGEPARFLLRYDAGNTIRLEVQSHPGSFMMVVPRNSSNSSYEDAANIIASNVPSNNGYEKWELKSGMWGSYFSHMTEEGECYATFEEMGAFCSPTLTDSSWVQLIWH